MSEKGACAGGLGDHAGVAGVAGPIRLLVVDRRPAVRKDLEIRPALGNYLEVVGEAADVTQAIQQAQAQRPDVILMDVDVPRGFAVTEALRTAQWWSSNSATSTPYESGPAQWLSGLPGPSAGRKGFCWPRSRGRHLPTRGGDVTRALLEQRGGTRECRA